jgi:hypothetical protein
MVVSKYPALFIASYASPAVMAPSPITLTTWFPRPSRSQATAHAQRSRDGRGSCGPRRTRRSRFANPASPDVCRMVCIRDRRPVRILCGHAWCPTSQMILSSGVSNTWCSATAPAPPRRGSSSGGCPSWTPCARHPRGAPHELLQLRRRQVLHVDRVVHRVKKRRRRLLARANRQEE